MCVKKVIMFRNRHTLLISFKQLLLIICIIQFMSIFYSKAYIQNHLNAQQEKIIANISFYNNDKRKPHVIAAR